MSNITGEIAPGIMEITLRTLHDIRALFDRPEVIGTDFDRFEINGRYLHVQYHNKTVIRLLPY